MLPLYFHTNTEMALYFAKDLLSDEEEHSMSEIYDYVMERCKGHMVMGEPMRATVISSAVWRLAHTDGSGYCRTRRGIYQKGAPEACKKERPTPYEKAARIVARAEREIAGSFYVGLDREMGEETSMQMQKVGREVLEKLAQIKGSLMVSQQEFKREKNCETEKMSGMSMEM